MKKILDACCGSRMCWFDKDNPDTVFMDCRSEEHTLCDGRRLEIRPDVVGDFRKMPFPDNSDSSESLREKLKMKIMNNSQNE